MKECVKRLWNTLITTFLNIKLQRLCKSHHLQCITSSKDSESGEISVHKGQGRRPLLDARGLRALWRHCITHRHDSVIDITKWAQEYFQKPLSVNTIHRAICRWQLKIYHAKRKPYVNMVQKRRRVLWAKAHLKWTVSKWKSALWSDESKFDILVGKPHTAAITTAWLRSWKPISDKNGTKFQHQNSRNS